MADGTEKKGMQLVVLIWATASQPLLCVLIDTFGNSSHHQVTAQLYRVPVSYSIVLLNAENNV